MLHVQLHNIPCLLVLFYSMRHKVLGLIRWAPAPPSRCFVDDCSAYEVIGEESLVNSTLPNEENEAYVLRYTAQDASGNQAVVVERVVVV